MAIAPGQSARSLPVIDLAVQRSQHCRFKCGSACHHDAPNEGAEDRFENVMARAMSRRAFLGGVAGAAMLVAAPAGALAAPVRATPEPSAEPDAPDPGRRLRFAPVTLSTADAVDVPDGYESDVLLRWGDPVLPGAPAFDADALTAAGQRRQFGYNADMIAFFPLPHFEARGASRAILAVNHEYTNPELMFAGYDPEAPLDVLGPQVAVELAAHGPMIESDPLDHDSRSVRLPSSSVTYTWHDGWGELPAPSDPAAWAHPGLVVTAGGDVLVADTAAPIVQRLESTSGTLVESIPLPTTEIHGLALEPGTHDGVLWVADQGVRLSVSGGETVRTGPGAGRVVRIDLRSGRLAVIEQPVHDVYAERPYRPTFVAFDPGSDDVWIADGYGGHVVHRYGRDGSFRGSIGHGQGAPFDTPHGVMVDRRHAEPRLLVTDRVNRRVLGYDLDGSLIGEFGTDLLTSPSGLLAVGDLTLVAELHGSLAVLDPELRVIGRIGQGDLPDARDAWPNERRSDGSVGRPALVPGRFNSPHAVDVGPDGSIFVAEFVLGGRLVRLTPDVR